MAPAIIDHPSPNFDARPDGQAIDFLLLHYTGMPSAEVALARLCDPEAKVSAHYVIDEDGQIFHLVPESRRAWHAGVSAWAGVRDINGRSIGIELVNPGHEFGYRPFPKSQMEALVDLANGILDRHPIPPQRVLGHSDVAPLRKQDPGELFDWKALADSGIGLWPDSAIGQGTVVHDATSLLRCYGYPLSPAPSEVERKAVVVAFQRHFRAADLSGVLDDECCQILTALVTQLDEGEAGP